MKTRTLLLTLAILLLCLCQLSFGKEGMHIATFPTQAVSVSPPPTSLTVRVAHEMSEKRTLFRFGNRIPNLLRPRRPLA
jgi:hypothetical protein